MTDKNTERTPGLSPPFKKGESGNPRGRPKGSKDGLRAHLNRLLKKTTRPGILELLKSEGVNLVSKSNSSAVAFALVKTAQAGDVSAIKLIFEQTEIPLPKQVDVSGSLDLTSEEMREMAAAYLK